MAGGRQADVEVSRKGGQQPSDHEIFGADGEGADGQPNEGTQRCTHERSPHKGY